MTPEELQVGEQYLDFRKILDANNMYKPEGVPLSRIFTKVNALTSYFGDTGNVPTEELERLHAEQSLAEVTGYITNWERMNKVRFPREALAHLNNKNFWKWWNHKPDGLHSNLKAGPSKVSDNNYKIIGNIDVPELVYHGTIYTINRNTGFVQTHPDMIEGGYENWSAELGPHLGTRKAAEDILLNDPKFQPFEMDLGRSKYKRKKVVEETRKFTRGSISGEGGKFYMGFLKINNPLVMEDLHSWNFRNVMDYLSEYGYFNRAGYANPKYEGDTKVTGFSGRGSVMDKIASYIDEMSVIDTTRTMEDRLQIAESAVVADDFIKYDEDLEHYKLRAISKFIQDDLGYDGIKYTNEAEDVGSWSYIIFNPNQFKSIHNDGQFNWQSQDFLTRTNTNKYRKVS